MTTFSLSTQARAAVFFLRFEVFWVEVWGWGQISGPQYVPVPWVTSLCPSCSRNTKSASLALGRMSS